MLTVLLIKRRAKSPTDDRLAARQTVQSCACDFESKRRLTSPMRPEIRQCAHISPIRLRQRRDNPDWKPKPNSYGLTLK
jgi:hypothetical protein